MEKGRDGRRVARFCWPPCKGDVHDIGKNLVEIILANNGYDGRESGDQGAAADDLISAYLRAPAGCHRPFGAAGEKRAADGDYGGRFQGRGDSSSAAGGRRGAFREVHAHENRAGLRRSGLLREGCDERRCGLMNQLMNPSEREAVWHSTGSIVTGHPMPHTKSPLPRLRRRRPRAIGAARKCTPMFRFRPRRTWTAGCASRRIWRKCGATSIPTRCMESIWDTGGDLSRRSELDPKAVELTRKWKR